MPGHVSPLFTTDRNGKKVPKRRADGSNIWRARYPDPAGKRATDQIERRFRSKAEAEAWIKRQGVDVLDGTHVDPRRGERPVSEIADAWRETWTDLEPKTRVGYANILDKHILPRFGRAKVGAVSPESVQRWINDLAGTHAPNTVRRIYSVLRSVLRVAVERRYIAVNPCDAVKLPRAGRRREDMTIDPLTHAEVAALLDGSRTTTGSR